MVPLGSDLAGWIRLNRRSKLNAGGGSALESCGRALFARFGSRPVDRPPCALLQVYTMRTTDQLTATHATPTASARADNLVTTRRLADH